MKRELHVPRTAERRAQYVEEREGLITNYLDVRLPKLLLLRAEMIARHGHGSNAHEEIEKAIRNVKSKAIRAGREVVRVQQKLKKQRFAA
jgi:hypothetical protein